MTTWVFRYLTLALLVILARELWLLGGDGSKLKKFLPPVLLWAVAGIVFQVLTLLHGYGIFSIGVPFTYNNISYALRVSIIAIAIGFARSLRRG